VATAVGVSVGRDGLVGGISVGGDGGVAVKTKGGVGWAEHEEKRTMQRAESKMRVVMRGGMGSILTELSTKGVSRINEKISCQVPGRRN
jgi:hypothetical protein